MPSLKYCQPLLTILFVLNLSQIAFSKSPLNGVELSVVYPEPGDTLNYDRVRFAGSTSLDAQVWVQDQQVRVYPSGAFAGLVELEPGWNKILFEAVSPSGSATEIISIFRDPESLSYPAIPTAVKANEIRPSRDVFIVPGEELKVSFRGSTGGIASFAIPGLVENVKMNELPVDKAGGLTGVYQGKCAIPEAPDYPPIPVMFTLRGKDGHGFHFYSSGKINVLRRNQPLLAVTNDSTSFILDEPNGRALMYLPPGSRLRVVGGNGDFLKVKLSAQQTGYIAIGQVLFLSPDAAFPYAALGPVTSVHDSLWLHFRFGISEQVPFQIETFAKPQALELSFYRAVRAPDWTIAVPEDPEVRRIRYWQKDGDIFVLRFEFRRPHWGYSAQYLGEEFVLSIRRAPAPPALPDFPLTGLTICVDAGHGGENDGATGATGLTEKSANLRWAQALAPLLYEKGANVIMTRNQDRTLSLPERVRIARSNGAALFISLHNNSINPNIDPLRPQGTSCYFTTQHSEDLARLVFRRMTETGLKPMTNRTAPFFVTRQTDMVAILVEGAFITHPEDEMRLASNGFIRKMADAVAAGIVDFVIGNQPNNP